MEKKAKTLADAAQELNLTKSTISRALSGRGRVSPVTKQKIFDWAEKNKFSPNSIAKSLAKNKSFNIGIVLPENTENHFFHQCTLDLSTALVKAEYDAVVIVDYGDDLSSLKRIIRNKKVDGIILTRILERDRIVSFLQKEEVPFVVIGSSSNKKILQVDVDHKKIAADCTQCAIDLGCKNFVLLGGEKKYLVNRDRALGFETALKKNNIPFEEKNIVWDIRTDTPGQIEEAVKEALKNNADCILCMDDLICKRVLTWLETKNYRVPEDLCLVSFYGSKLLENKEIPVLCANVNTSDLCNAAGKKILDFLQTNSVQAVTKIQHTIKNPFLNLKD